MKIKITFLLLLAAALVSGCTDSASVANSNANDLGTFQGKVALSDLNCDSMSNRAGVRIQIEGTSFSTQTNTSGRWEIDNVPAGIYNLIITKSGFDTDLIAEDQFAGDGTEFLENGAIHAVPMDSVQIVSIRVTRKDSFYTFMNDTTRKLDSNIVGNEYTVIGTFSINGPDSAINFRARLRDVTDSTAYFLSGLFPLLRVSKSGNLAASAFFISTKRWAGNPQPGDSLVLTTYPVSACSQKQGPNILSKGFVLP